MISNLAFDALIWLKPVTWLFREFNSIQRVRRENQPVIPLPRTTRFKKLCDSSTQIKRSLVRMLVFVISWFLETNSKEARFSGNRFATRTRRFESFGADIDKKRTLCWKTEARKLTLNQPLSSSFCSQLPCFIFWPPISRWLSCLVGLPYCSVLVAMGGVAAPSPLLDLAASQMWYNVLG